MDDIFEENFKWQNTHIPEIMEILKNNAHKIIKVYISSPEEDMKKATDLIIEVKGGNVAVRIRREVINKENGKPYRDWTIRSELPSGAKTELAKLKEGFANWYIYAWTDNFDKIVSWVLIDMKKVLDNGLLNRNWNEPRNTKTDNKKFLAIPIDNVDLKNCGCIVSSFGV